jgi:hypothetical protein
VVEGRELLELVVGQEPEVQQGGREGWVNVACSELHEGREWQGHMLEFFLEDRVLNRAFAAKG